MSTCWPIRGRRIRIGFSRPVDPAALGAIDPTLILLDPQTAAIDLADDESARLGLLGALVAARLPVLSFAPEQLDLSRFYLDNLAADQQARRQGAAA